MPRVGARTAAGVAGGLRVPSAPPGGLQGPLVAAGVVLACLWALPVVDEFAGDYHNVERILGVVGKAGPRHPWPQAIASVGSFFALGDRAHAAGSLPGSPGVQAALLVALVGGGLLAARRRGAMTALALGTAVALAAAVLGARSMPGRVLPSYVLQWVSALGVAALLVAGTEILARLPRLARGVSGRPGRLALLALPSVLLAHEAQGMWIPAEATRNPKSVRVEALAHAIESRLAFEPDWRFLVRVARPVDRSIALGLVLALDKAGLHFGVEPFGSSRLVGRFTPRGDERGRLLVGPFSGMPGEPVASSEGLCVSWIPPR